MADALKIKELESILIDLEALVLELSDVVEEMKKD